MEKIITARHFHLREDAKVAIRGRLAELEDEYRSLTSARVILDKVKSTFDAEIVVRGRHMDIEARGKAKNPLHAFDLACDRAERQVRKHYDKVKDHKNAPISQLECEIEEFEMALIEDEEEIFDSV